RRPGGRLLRRGPAPGPRRRDSRAQGDEAHSLEAGAPMKARIVEAQADLFEVGVLSQTAEVESVSMDRLLADPSGPPLVVVGGLLGAERLADMRKLSSGLARARVAVIVVPPFTDLDVGRYFETPVQLGVRRRAAEPV